jgi:hypothetical protein
VDVQRRDLSFDPLGVTQQQIALLARRLVSARPVGRVCAHVFDAHAHDAQACQRLQRVEVVLAVAPVPAAFVALNRAYQPNLLVVAQRWLAETAAPGYILDGQSCHTSRKTNLKRFKSSGAAEQGHSRGPAMCLPVPGCHGSARRLAGSLIPERTPWSAIGSSSKRGMTCRWQWSPP